MTKYKSKGGRSGATLIYDTGERDDDALERMQWVLPVAFLGALLVLFFAVMEWFRPHVPVMLFAAIVWLPLGAFMLWRAGIAKWKQVMLAMVAMATFAAPLLAWNAGLYRATAFGMVHELTPVDLSLKASDDRSDRVAAMACERMLESQELTKLRRAQNVLQERPEMALQCLDGLDDGGQGAVVRLARHLHVHWYDGWMDPDRPISEDVGCEAARQYQAIGGLYGDQGTPQLLSCTLGSEHEHFARCCGQALGGIEDPSSAVAPQHWIHDLEEPLFELLVQKADLPAQRLLSEESVVDALDWAPRELFHWKTQLGCYLTSEKTHSEPIARQLSRSIETQCGLEIDDPLYSRAGVRFVESTCKEAVSSEERQQTVDVVEWCDAARTANLDYAVDSAKFLVHRAQRAYGVDLLEEIMTQGSDLQAGLADEQSRFSLDDRGRLRVVDDARVDGVRMRRAQWTEHTSESQRRGEAMDELQEERRQRARERLEADQEQRTPEEQRREVQREAGQQIMEDIEELRQRGR